MELTKNKTLQFIFTFIVLLQKMAWNSFLSIQTAKLNARKLFNLKNNIKKSKGQIVSKHGSSSDL